MKSGYRSMDQMLHMGRRSFLKLSGAAGTGILLGTPAVWAQDQQKKPEPPKTNIDDALKIPRTPHSLPGPFPGKVVRVFDENVLQDNQPQADAVKAMFERGLGQLTGKSLGDSFGLFFEKDDIVGIKVNPVGAGFINTRHELVDAVIAWLETNGLPRKNIVIWDRFDYMLKDAGFTAERFPGVQIEGLQTMDEEAYIEKRDNSAWLIDGHHVSEKNFDKDTFYLADVEASQETNYLNQHVVNGKYSYFGKLLTQKLTKIINLPAMKNTGNGISLATKNLGYGSICNTGRLHRPLFFNVCTEVLAFPVLRDKLVLNIADGIRGQYDGGPMLNAQFVWDLKTLFFATDPFAMDMVGHNLLLEKRKEMGVKVNEHPRYTEYLRYAEKLGIGVVDPAKMKVIEA
jgi:hypothetical protein